MFLIGLVVSGPERQLIHKNRQAEIKATADIGTRGQREGQLPGGALRIPPWTITPPTFAVPRTVSAVRR